MIKLLIITTIDTKQKKVYHKDMMRYKKEVDGIDLKSQIKKDKLTIKHFADFLGFTEQHLHRILAGQIVSESKYNKIINKYKIYANLNCKKNGSKNRKNQNLNHGS